MLYSYTRRGTRYNGNLPRRQDDDDEEYEPIYAGTLEFTGMRRAEEISRGCRCGIKTVGIPLIVILAIFYLAGCLAVPERLTLTNGETDQKTKLMPITKIYNYISSYFPTNQEEILVDISNFDELTNALTTLNQRLSTVEMKLEDTNAVNSNKLGLQIAELQKQFGELSRKVEKISSGSSADDLHDEIGQMKAGLKTTGADFDGCNDKQRQLNHRIEDFMKEQQQIRNEISSMQSKINAIDRKASLDIGNFTSGIDSSHVAELISSALAKYDADKTGLPDYALESAGGSIVGVRCTKTYSKAIRQEAIFGIPLWSQTFSPRTVIQASGFSPGECWAFEGSHGFLVLQLAGRINITAVSYEHIPKNIAPNGNIESAPNLFEVHALNKSDDEVGLKLGRFKYDANGPALQTFPVQIKDVTPTKFVEIKFLKNHGHPAYTCLYRLRIHGTRMEKKDDAS